MKDGWVLEQLVKGQWRSAPDEKPELHTDEQFVFYLRSHVRGRWKVEAIGYGWILLSAPNSPLRRWRLASSQPPTQEVLR